MERYEADAELQLLIEARNGWIASTRIMIRELRQIGAKPELIRKAVRLERHLAERDGYFPMRCTAKSLYREACRLVRIGRSSLPWEADPNWVNPRSTETYSACGYEDGLVMEREWALKDAMYFFRLWKAARKLEARSA